MAKVKVDIYWLFVVHFEVIRDGSTV